MKGFQLKNSLPYLKYVLRLSCVVHGSIYGRFTAFYVNGFLSCKPPGLHRRDVTHILSKVSCFYWNPFIFVGYRNDRFFFPYKSLYFECYATTPKLADAHFSSLGYLWVIWLLYHFVMTSTAFHFPWLTSRTLYKKKKNNFLYSAGAPNDNFL